MRTLAFIPTGHKLAINDLHTHEYFGEDFKEGKATVAIFQTYTGKLRAVWSYQGWDWYKFSKGDDVLFEHTQSMKKTCLTFVTVLPSTESFDGKKVPNWTLK